MKRTEEAHKTTEPGNGIPKCGTNRRKMKDFSTGRQDCVNSKRMVTKSNAPNVRSSALSNRIVGCRHPSTPMKNRSQVVKGSLRSVDRVKPGIPIGFRKTTKTHVSMKGNPREVSKGSMKIEKQHEVATAVDNSSLNINDHAFLSEHVSESTSAKHSIASSANNMTSLKSKIGLSFSFRKSSKPKIGSSNEYGIKDHSSDNTNLQLHLEAAKREIERKSSLIESLKCNIDELMESKNLLEKRVGNLYHEIETMRKENYQLCPSIKFSSSVNSTMDETFGDYSLFDQSQNIACLQDQLSKMKEHNVSTTEELHATIEELKELREKTHCLKEQNRSLVSEQRMLCESLCHQSELANQYEQQIAQLETLCKASDISECDYRQKLFDIVHSIEIERKSIMTEFSVLKDQYSALEVEFEDTKFNSNRYKEESDRWKKKFEKLKKLHSGYSMRLSLLTVADKENHKPLSDASFQLSPEKRATCDAYTKEIKRLNDVIEGLKLRNEADPNESELTLLRSEKEALLVEYNILRTQIDEERKSWNTFQSDLLTAIRVADTYRQEAENEAKRLSNENEKYRIEVRHLRKDVERLRRSGFALYTTTIPSSSSVKSIVENLEARIREFDVSSSTKNEFAKSGANSDKSYLNIDTMERNMGLLRSDSSKYTSEFSNYHHKQASVNRTTDTVTNQQRQTTGDPLHDLVRQGCGSRRNALLHWCQDRTRNYQHVDITNFSSSWADGLAFCALLSSFRSDIISYEKLLTCDRVKNVSLALSACDAIGIDHSFITESDITATERPSWEKVMCLVNKIYCHFVSNTGQSSDNRNENAFNHFPQTHV